MPHEGPGAAAPGKARDRTPPCTRAGSCGPPADSGTGSGGAAAPPPPSSPCCSGGTCGPTSDKAARKRRPAADAAFKRRVSWVDERLVTAVHAAVGTINPVRPLAVDADTLEPMAPQPDTLHMWGLPWWDERSVPCHLDDPHSEGEAAVCRGGPAVMLARVVIDVDCPYTRPLVLAALSRRAHVAVVVLPPPDEEDTDDQLEERALRAQLRACGPSVAAAASPLVLFWGEYERVAWELVQAGQLGASAYCLRKGLIRKANFAVNLKKYISKHPGCVLSRCVPETLLFELYHPDYLEEALCDVPEVRDAPPGSRRFIIKPSLTNQARGILVFDCVDALAAHVSAEGHEDLREWVIQAYVDQPLLLAGGRKFHVRIYALCVGALEAYVYDEGLLLFAARPYDLTDLTDASQHLTNTCRAVAAGALPPDGSELVHLLSNLPTLIMQARGWEREQADAAARILWAQIRSLVGEMFAAASSDLSFFPLPGCFEHFGLDILVDEQLAPWLLEANAEPDFAQTGPHLRPLIEGLIEATMRLAIDPRVVQARAAGHGDEPALQPPAPPPGAVPYTGIGTFVKVYERAAGGIFGGRGGGGGAGGQH